MTAHAVITLRSEADVADHRDVGGGDGGDGRRHGDTTFQFDRLGSLFHETNGRLHGLLSTGLVRTERKVTDHERFGAGPSDASDVVRHFVEIDRNGVAFTLHNHGE